MTDPLSIAASAAGFIGLAGQILQGCQYICNFVDDVREAPDIIRQFNAEIRGLRAAVLGFQQVLRRLEHVANLETVAEQIGLALNSANLAINELKALVEKYEHTGEKDWWMDLKVTRKKMKFVKCFEKLGRAKADIALAQSSALLILGLSQSSEFHHANLSITSLVPYAASISQSTATTQSVIEQLQESSIDTRQAVETIGANLSDQMGLLQEKLELVLQSTVNDVRDQFLAEVASRSQAMKSFSNSTSSTEIRRLEGQSTKYTFASNHKRQTRTQTSYCRAYHVWFATITIIFRSTTTQQYSNPSRNEKSDVHEVISSRVVVNIRPHRWITLRGMLAILDRQWQGSSFYDAKLRTYNIIREDSPIVLACEIGDITSARELFATGQASPYDVVFFHRTTYSKHSSLLEVTIQAWTRWVWKINTSEFSDDITEHTRELKNMFEFFTFLVDHGLDPGEQMSSLPFRISSLLAYACASPFAITSHLGDMLRYILARSTVDPFAFDDDYSKSMFLARMGIIPEIASCISGQESWFLPQPPTEYVRPWNYQLYGLPDTENLYYLIRDPEANYIRTSLRWMASFENAEYYMAIICLRALYETRKIPGHEKGAYDLAIHARLLACFEHGMSPKQTGTGGRLRLRHISVAQYYIGEGKERLLESALLQAGWLVNDIHMMLDEEACAQLVDLLDSLRPITIMKQAGRKLSSYSGSDISQDVISYQKNRDLASDGGYRRYFPEDEVRLRRVVTHYDRYLPGKDLPAVNGITQDFWD